MGEVKYNMDVRTWWLLFCPPAVLLFLCACLYVVHEGLCPLLLPLLLNDVPFAYLPLFARCSMQVWDNCCLLQSLKNSPYFAAFSDHVQL